MFTNILTSRNKSTSISKLSGSVCTFCFSLDNKKKRIQFIFRPTVCDYSLLGCNWNGPYHSLSSHLDICEYPAKNGMELIDTIRAQKRAYDEEKKCLETVVDLLSLNQIGVSGKLFS